MSRKMSDHIKMKEYKFPDGETVTAYFDEYGIAKITIQALDAIFDNFINSADRVEVVRCKDCRFFKSDVCPLANIEEPQQNDYCSYGERAET